MIYVLSEFAEHDIEDIYNFGSYKFGTAQALQYLENLELCFETLCKNPTIGRCRNEIKNGLLSLPYHSHIIFYRITPSYIRVIRILHGSRDIPSHF